MIPEAVSWYKGSFDPSVKGESTWQAALAAISTDRYRDLIAKARDIRKTQGEDAYREFKKDLPAVSFCGTFDKQRSKKTILNATGFIVADLDHLPDVEKTFESVTADELTWFAFRSPSGDGIKVGLRAEGIKDDTDIKRLFGPVERYYREVYGIKIDPACKDICRLTYLSHDPGAYVNPSPVMFDMSQWGETPEAPTTEPKVPPRIEGAGKAKYAARVVEGCCKAIRESLPGNQHHTRLSQGRLAGGYAHYLSESTVLADLEQAVRESGAKNLSAAMKTLHTAFTWGLAAPVTIPDLDPAEARDDVPEGFQAKENGIYFKTEDKEGNQEWHWLCSPLKVLALTREGDDLEWGRLVEVRDPDGNAHRWAMPMRALRGSGDDLRGELLAMGLCLTPGKGPALLNKFLSLCRPRSRVRCVPRIGWHGRRFILPDAVYGFEAGESVILQAERVDNPFRVQGTLADWQESIGRFCVGNSRLALSVSAALAAPMLYLAGAESGGLHLVGGSSLGKTTALVVAGSVCGGGGVRGYVMQWRATANGLEGVAVAHCDALLCLDELSQVTPQAAGETAYMMTNETGKTRARRDGSGRPPAEWRILFLSTGEITLADKIKEDGKTRAMAGQLVRVVDIYADAGAGLGIFEDLHGFPDGDAFSRHLKESAKRTYGVALRAFLEKLTADHDNAMRVVPALIKTFTADHCPADADGQVRRVCNRFALLAAGGECGAAYGVLPWPKGEATQAAARCFRDWLVLRGGTGASEVRDGIAQVRAFFQAHGSSRFEVWGDRADEAKTINRAGFRRKDELTGAWEYFVPPAAFKAEIARGHDATRMVKELVGRGLIIPGANGQPASAHRIPGQPVARYYRFAPGIVSEESESSKNTVTTVTPVTPSNDAGSECNRAENAPVTPVTKAGHPCGPVTAVTAQKTERLQEKSCDYSAVTDVTAVTAKNDNAEQKPAPVIDMESAEKNGLWTGPAEVEI